MRESRELLEEGRGPRVPRSKGSKVQRSQGPKDQDISNSHSNTSLTLKKVHLVFSLNEVMKTINANVKINSFREYRN